MRDLNLTIYNQAFCYKMCYQDKLLQECSCVDAKYPAIRNSLRCIYENELDCLNKFDEAFSSANLETFCEFACPIQCETISYQMSTSMATYPTEYYSKLLESKIDFAMKFSGNDKNFFKYLKDYLIKVTVNYNELEYTYVEEVAATTPDSLVGNIGGQFGLFIGISLLSVIEIVEIIIQFIFIACSKRIRKISTI
jgi:hypothetical protein